MKILSFTLIIFFFFICTTLGLSQLSNGSFETWNDSIGINPHDISFIESANEALPLEWDNIYGEFVAPIGSYRTTDAVDGEYALVINTWYTYQITTLFQEGEISYRPNKFSGVYKYLQMANYDDVKDSASISIVLIDEEGLEIGSGSVYLDTIRQYTSFDMDIEYISETIPSTYYIEMKNAQRSCAVFDGSCNYFFVDNLKFELDTSTKNYSKSSQVRCYPNPSQGIIYFTEDVAYVEIYAMDGQLISTFSNGTQFDMPDKRGMYIIKWLDNNGLQSIQKVLKQ